MKQSIYILVLVLAIFCNPTKGLAVTQDNPETTNYEEENPLTFYISTKGNGKDSKAWAYFDDFSYQENLEP